MERNKGMEDKIRARLEEMRKMLQADGGDLEIVEIKGSAVKLKLKGACCGCPHAIVTLKQGLENALREEIDKTITVERVA
jgi:Fe-S cluster biogenesis protein NfuA